MGDNDREIQTVRIQRGNGAKHILEHPVFKEAIEMLRATNYAQFCSSTNLNDDERRALWAKKQAIDAVEDQLDSFVQTSLVDIAEIEAEKLEMQGKKE